MKKRTERCGAGLFAPVHAPNELFEEIDPVVIDGRVHKRIRMRGTSLIYTEDKMDQTFSVEIKSIEPMKAPVGSIFSYEYKYPT